MALSPSPGVCGPAVEAGRHTSAAASAGACKLAMGRGPLFELAGDGGGCTVPSLSLSGGAAVEGRGASSGGESKLNSF